MLLITDTSLVTTQLKPNASTWISLPLVLQLAGRPWVTDSRQSFPEPTLDLLNHFHLPLSLVVMSSVLPTSLALFTIY